ncbi:hypothetical protein FB451DRAFT_1257831 [Mycena latifolia]|nr:hypothetical protein FB451DRAFT_1257831 [Mycena latifolia]
MRLGVSPLGVLVLGVLGVALVLEPTLPALVFLLGVLRPRPGGGKIRVGGLVHVVLVPLPARVVRSESGAERRGVFALRSDGRGEGALRLPSGNVISVSPSGARSDLGFGVDGAGVGFGVDFGVDLADVEALDCENGVGRLGMDTNMEGESPTGYFDVDAEAGRLEAEVDADEEEALEADLVDASAGRLGAGADVEGESSACRFAKACLRVYVLFEVEVDAGESTSAGRFAVGVEASGHLDADADADGESFAVSVEPFICVGRLPEAETADGDPPADAGGGESTNTRTS